MDQFITIRTTDNALREIMNSIHNIYCSVRFRNLSFCWQIARFIEYCFFTLD